MLIEQIELALSNWEREKEKQKTADVANRAKKVLIFKYQILDIPDHKPLIMASFNHYLYLLRKRKQSSSVHRQRLIGHQGISKGRQA